MTGPRNALTRLRRSLIAWGFGLAAGFIL